MMAEETHLPSQITPHSVQDPENTANTTGLLHRLHRDEHQLRILAVVLSLTGGLVLSFALGVGILVVWYCRGRRRHRTKKRPIPAPVSHVSPYDPHTAAAIKIPAASMVTVAPSTVPPSPILATSLAMPSCPVTSTARMPLPSAPSAKDLDVNPDSAPPTCEHHRPLGMLLPPPAYTPHTES